MSSYSEPGYSYRRPEPHAAEYMDESKQGGGRVQLLIAILGMFSLAFMLWTIARMLGALPG